MRNTPRSLAELVLEAGQRTGKTLRPEFPTQPSLKQLLSTLDDSKLPAVWKQRVVPLFDRARTEMSEHSEREGDAAIPRRMT